MNEMQQRLGSAIVLITHDLGVVAETCKNVLVMYGGNYGGVRHRRRYLQPTEDAVHEGLLESLPRLDEVERAAGADRRASRRISCACRRAARSRRGATTMPICADPVPLYDFGAQHVARCFLYEGEVPCR